MRREQRGKYLEVLDHHSSKRIVQPKHLVYDCTQDRGRGEVVGEPLYESLRNFRGEVDQNALKDQEGGKVG
jgi:hypothetical protein